MSTFVWFCNQCGKIFPKTPGNDMEPAASGCPESFADEGKDSGERAHQWSVVKTGPGGVPIFEPNWTCRKCDSKVPVRNSPRKPPAFGCPKGRPPIPLHDWADTPLPFPVIIWNIDDGDADRRGLEGTSLKNQADEEIIWLCVKCGKVHFNTDGDNSYPPTAGCPEDFAEEDKDSGPYEHLWSEARLGGPTPTEPNWGCRNCKRVVASPKKPSSKYGIPCQDPISGVTYQEHNWRCVSQCPTQLQDIVLQLRNDLG